jgi:hypothetical protein
LADLILGKIVGHRIDEAEIVEPGPSKRAGDVSGPCRRPIARDFGAAGMIVGMQEQNSHIERPTTVNPY